MKASIAVIKCRHIYNIYHIDTYFSITYNIVMDDKINIFLLGVMLGVGIMIGIMTIVLY